MDQAKLRTSIIFFLLLIWLSCISGIPGNDDPGPSVEGNNITPSQVHSFLNISRTYLRNGQADSALISATKAVQIAESLQEPDLLAESFYLLYNIYKKFGEEARSMEYLRRSTDLADHISDLGLAIDIYSQRGYLYMPENMYDSSLYYFIKAKSLAKGPTYKARLSFVNENMGLAYQSKGDYLNAINSYMEFLNLSTDLKDSLGLIKAYFHLGGIYSLARQFHEATDNILLAKSIAQSTHNRSAEADAIKRLGEIALETDHVLDAMYDFRTAIEILDGPTDTKLEAYTYMELAEAYMKLKEVQQSLAVYDTSYDLFRVAGFDKGLAEVCLKRGNIYLTLNEPSKALESFTSALNKFDSARDKWGKADALAGIAEVYDESGESGQSVDYHYQALNIWRAINQKERMLETYLSLTDDFKKMGDFKQALEYHEMALDLSNSISSYNVTRATGELEVRAKAEQKDKEIALLSEYNLLKQRQLQGQKELKYFLLSILVLMMALSAGILHRNFYIRKTRNKLIDLNTDIIEEKAKSDHLLLNILPAETANELKKFGHAFAKKHESATVIFTDFKGFTKIAGLLDPADLIQDIGYCFMAFDEIVTNHNLEKIKTMGDAYMAAGGLPVSNDTHPVDAIETALQIKEFMKEFNKKQMKKGKPQFEIRIGIHTGPVISGVVGTRKFAFDIWGDTVNLAYCAQTACEPGRVNITRSTYELVKDRYLFTPRGQVHIKGDRDVEMYFVDSKK